MESPTPVRLVLRIDRVEPLAGELEAPSRPPRGFEGWSGLAVALESALHEHPPENEAPSED